MIRFLMFVLAMMLAVPATSQAQSIACPNCGAVYVRQAPAAQVVELTEVFSAPVVSFAARTEVVEYETVSGYSYPLVSAIVGPVQLATMRSRNRRVARLQRRINRLTR